MKPTYAQLHQEHSDLKHRFEAAHAEREFYWEKIQDYKYRTGIDILSTDECGHSSDNEKYCTDSWESLIEAWLEKESDEGRKVEKLTTTDILERAIGIADPYRHDRAAQMRVVHVMTRIGWVNKRGFWDGEGKPQTRRWVKSEVADGNVAASIDASAYSA